MTAPTPVYLSLAGLTPILTMHNALARALNADPAGCRVELRQLSPDDRDRLNVACALLAAAVADVNEEGS